MYFLICFQKKTVTYNGTLFSVGNIDIDASGSGSIKTNGGDIYTAGGSINSQGGGINTGGGTLDVAGGNINGSAGSTINVDTVNATVKNFDIEHPSKKEPWRLRYSVLEGPEVGVFVRGQINGSNIIELPYYWKELVYENSLTINLTAIGNPTIYYVEKIAKKKEEESSEEEK